MIIYEITTTVSPELIDAYEKYMLEAHIPELLETGYFGGAEMARSGEGRYRIRYISPDRKSLDLYLANDAARLREDFLNHFPDGIELAREVWEVLKSLRK